MREDHCTSCWIQIPKLPLGMPTVYPSLTSGTKSWHVLPNGFFSPLGFLTRYIIWNWCTYMVLLHLTFMHISLQTTHIMRLPEAIFNLILELGGEAWHFCFLVQPCDALMDHSSAWVFSKATYPPQDMRLQAQNGCPVICALFIGNTSAPSWLCCNTGWPDSDVFTEILHWKAINTKHKKIFFMQIPHSFIPSRHLLWSRVPDVEKTSSEGKGRGSTWLHERASGSCHSGKHLSRAGCPERKRSIWGTHS